MTLEKSAEPALDFELNGRAMSVHAEADLTLLDLLRDQLGVMSPKNGCQPMGQCGCCTVLLDDRPILSCVTPARKVAGRRVTTIEGLDPDFQAAVSQSFSAAGAVQCGFCTPGIVVRTHALLEKTPDPSREEASRALVPHLCRCTGYHQIIDGIVDTAAVLRGERELPVPDVSGRVGTSLPKYQATETALGRRPFIDDIHPDGVVFGVPVFTAHARAVIKAIDASAAEAMPGVVRVLIATDIPGARRQGLVYADWPQMIAVGETTHCVGDIVALVVAEDARTARRAVEAVKVTYDVLEPVTDPEAALADDAPVVHPDTHPQGNLLSRSCIRQGEDVETVFARCEHVVEESFATQRIEHAFLEPESAIAFPWNADGVMEVLSQGQGVFDDRRQIASLLGVETERVRVTLVANGGAFGGKEDLSIQGHAALIAHHVGRPAKITLTRLESMRLHPKRHAIRMKYKVGCDADGHILAVHGRMIGDKGAYASVGSKVLERAGGHATGAYRVPNLDIEALAVYTNNPPCGAMRGFGANQAAFAIEGCLDRLAERVGIDGWEIRWRNALEQGDTFCSGQVLDKPFGLKKTLEAVRDVYRGAKLAGIACGIKNVGIGNGMPDQGQAVIRVEDGEGAFTIFSGFTEMGQGLLTLLIQSACEVVPTLNSQRGTVIIDTSHATPCGMTTASRATVLGCLAVQRAARKLAAELERGATLTSLAGREFLGEVSFDYTVPLGDTVGKNGGPVRTHITFGFATQVVILNDDGTLERVVAAHDVGRVMNPTLLRGQIVGSVHMGLGYALTEDFPCDENGVPTAKRFNDLGILRSTHMPEVDCIFIEEQDPECPWGAKGVGEIGLVPTAPAVAAALHAHDGQWRTTLPMRESAAARKILGKKS
ncbi:selenium-dependent xanthine dehydrogenase [candidate division BRC1 bacterium HGW-BRC1-1]|jgi:xanthine dehydrogenase molybdenum-binding subunit|nr:MAG: selenium-dependent xanthine dehydrogenase [candidate division BRC1 bacterium HGW-BRC1-1]